MVPDVILLALIEGISLSANTPPAITRPLVSTVTLPYVPAVTVFASVNTPAVDIDRSPLGVTAVAALVPLPTQIEPLARLGNRPLTPKVCQDVLSQYWTQPPL